MTKARDKGLPTYVV